MKLTTGLQILSSKNLEKTISKKILLANTSDRVIDKKAQEAAVGVSSDPAYLPGDSINMVFNPDIRYRNYFTFSPLTNIDYRNNLLIFAENKEIRKAVRIIANETVVTQTELFKYPVYPDIAMTQVPEDKQKICEGIMDYLNKYFYPKLYQMYNFKKDGLNETVKEYLKTGKLAYEIIYDNLQNPKDIIGIQPIDPGCLQKFKYNDITYYVQRGALDTSERVLADNQVVLVEYNEYDYGYVSFVDSLRMSFNIMRSMSTSKALWFAAKSQVRMHINLELGELSYKEAKQRLSEARNDYTNTFSMTDLGVINFNNQPNNTGFREFFTASSANGAPSIEEINANGPDLSEVDSLDYWSKLFWQDTEIPMSRIDPSANETWGFTDVEALNRIEITFSKFIQEIRDKMEVLFLKPIIIQLTLKEVEIGIDLALLDYIKIKWLSFNQYEKMAELEILNKRVEIAKNVSDFGSVTDVYGNERQLFPIDWLSKNFLEFTEEQLKDIDAERVRQNIKLGFTADGRNPQEVAEEEEQKRQEEEERRQQEEEETSQEDEEVEEVADEEPNQEDTDESANQEDEGEEQ